MYTAGNPTKPQLSDLYLRYDCNSQTIFALVLKQSGYSIEGSPWIKIYELGNSPRVDDSYNPPNGVQPEFSWVPPSATVQANTEGYEASFSLAPGNYTMEAHVSIASGQTSSTGRSDSFINVALTCPTESLGVSKTANPFYLENYDWTITKAVNPDSHTMFIGDAAQTSTYTVTVDQTLTSTGQKVMGTITIANSTTKNAIIANVIDTITPGNIPVAVNCSVTFPYTLTAGQTLTCSYTQTLASAFSGQNEVIVLPGNGSGLKGGRATANFSFGTSTPKETTGYPTVDVVDTKQGVLQTGLGGDKTFTYDTNFGCPTDPAQYVNGKYETTYDNTANVQKDTTVIDSDSASVKKTCYAPVVTKTANPSITQTLGWTLNKQVSPTALSMNAGESNPVHYTVTVGTEVINTSYAVSGTITVANPNPSQSMTVPVTDVLAGGINATVDCGGSATLTVPANSSATCTYSTNLPDSATRLNTATATLNNIGFTGTATVNFNGVVPTVVGPTPSPATVTDTNAPAGSPWSTSGPMTQNYDETLTCSTNPADYQNGHYSFPHPNTAAITGTTKSSTATVNVDCYAPLVSKTAAPAIARTLGWTIQKQVTPTELSMNIGDSGQAVHYTVTVGTEPIAALTQYTVTGSIVVTNPNPNQPMTVAIADMLPDSTNMVLNCNGGLNPTIPAGGQVNCTYSASLPNGSTRTNTATATLNGLVVNGTAPVDFSNVTPTDTGPTPSPASVTDTNLPAGSPWTTSGPMTQNYDETLTCSTNSADYSGGHYSFPHPNTAAIDGTTKSSTATVNVDCYAPLVSKTATTSFIRTHQWGIDKMANIGPNDILLQVGQTYYFTYDITVNVTGQNDTGVTVEGDITVQNPNPNSAMNVSVADALPDATNVTLDCGGTLSVPAGNSASCHYHATLPDNSTGTNRTNVATVTLNGVDFNAQTAVTFGTPAQEKDTCVTVTDQIAANPPWTAAMNTAVVTLGTVCVSDSLPKVFSYPLTAGPYDAATASACQLPNNPATLINNTATYTVTDNSSVSGTAEEHVPVCVPQAGGCTLTQGYWKTHSTHGKAPTSEGWIVFAPTNVAGVVDNSQVVNLADRTFFKSGKTYYQVLWTPPQGNAYYNLAHQWIATYLNQINGASMPTTVSTAFISGWTLLAANTPTQVAGSKTLTAQAKALNTTLDNYNQGNAGVSHCSNDVSLFGGE
ncbi:hypothetical protein THII_2686 [Thioploca ingrica]|uniref:Uncharacterized protein n=1 Tax=Thioploca ingrica TaxID=40754 RepID=A0A090AFR4_9GAMM|nr:hypothetical protein THII_2686 [Thioploca ingrica]